MDKNKQNIMADQPASLWRIIGAWIYDGLLLLAVLFVATAFYLILMQLSDPVDASAAVNLSANRFTGGIYYVYIFTVAYLFLGWFWTHGGQTLGLRAWSLRIQTPDGYAISWLQALLRLMTAAIPWVLTLYLFKQLHAMALLSMPSGYLILLLGFTGLLWAKLDRNQRSIQDIASGTRIVRINSNK